jgi:large subunit ribosomal protein L13
MKTLKEHTIDAAGRTIGRVASEAANLLRGKDSPDFERNLVSGAKVTIINAGQVKIINDKLNTRYHKHYTGNPGGMRFETNKTIAGKKGFRELMRLAVFGMLPDNKLKPLFMKNLTINE